MNDQVNNPKLLAAYEGWRTNPSRVTKNDFIDQCRGQDPRAVAEWFESPFYLAALAEAEG